MGQGFDPIGPFDFKRTDQIAAACYLGLVFGGKMGMAVSYGVLLIGIAGLISGVLSGEAWPTGAGVVLPLLVFIVLPALRSNRRNRSIVVSDGEQGLEVETDQVRTLYKWGRIGPARVFADRLFVKIDANLALVIPQRATSVENFDRLAAAVAQRGGEAKALG